MQILLSRSIFYTGFFGNGSPSRMYITSSVFEAYLKCQTKCTLRAHGERGTGNLYADWVRTQTESYRNNGVARLSERFPPDEVATGLTGAIDVKTTQWRLAVDFTAQTLGVKTRVHAVERIPSAGRGKSAVFIPVRFIFRNKLNADDKLLLAFDAFALSSVLGRTVYTGKIIHGEDRAVSKVKLAGLTARISKSVERVNALLGTATPPETVLRKHCAECEFQSLCRQKAVEKDDLSLLAGMSERERKKFNSKGIFTVTQLSYTFRPCRRPKHLSDRREKYHHSLKALAIREKKIHIVGNPELKIDGTPVYFDVEGLPDRGFYYLIGMRIGNGDAAIQHSLWADNPQEEKRIWTDFLTILTEIENPVLIHYGSYETTFLKRMCDRYGKSPAECPVTKAVESPANVLSTMFSQIYFPTYSNSLKEVAQWLGFAWPDSSLAGANSIAHRSTWESSRDSKAKQELVSYNAGDCAALELVVEVILGLSQPDGSDSKAGPITIDVVNADALETRPTMWPQFKSSIAEFNQINQAARWDYQRDRIYVRTDKRIKSSIRRRARRSPGAQVFNKTVAYRGPTACPHCARRGMVNQYRSRVLYDLHFGRWSLKRWIVRYEFCVYYCRTCRTTFGTPDAFWTGSKYGRNLANYVIYNLVELCIPQRVITQSINRLFGYDLVQPLVHRFKAGAAASYTETTRRILQRMLAGPVILADETHIGIKGKRTYVWVFTSLREVVYIHSETREGDIVQKTLSGFKGILVSDFYSAYDSMDCPQQKCLIHLIRDLNDELLAQPYDEELRALVNGFAGLLKPMIETVDRCGLKKYFLKKHIPSVDRFFRGLGRSHFTSEAAERCKVRFEKNGEKLFTFLDYDGVPWNNNNAEHAIKAFARLRRVIEGLSTLKGIDEYLVLMSICQTCKYQGLDFLDFLRSGETDIEVFAQSTRKRGRCRRSRQ